MIPNEQSWRTGIKWRQRSKCMSSAFLLFRLAIIQTTMSLSQLAHTCKPLPQTFSATVSENNSLKAMPLALEVIATATTCACSKHRNFMCLKSRRQTAPTGTVLGGRGLHHSRLLQKPPPVKFCSELLQPKEDIGPPWAFQKVDNTPNQ